MFSCIPSRPSNFWKFDMVYHIGYGFATTKVRYGGLRLRHVVAEDTFFFSYRTKDAIFVLVTKIVCSSSTLTGHRAADKLSVFVVAL